MKNRTFLFALIIQCFLITTARSDCSQIAQKSSEALSWQDTSMLRQLNKEAARDSSCTDDFRQWLGRQTAVVQLSRARKLVQQGESKQAIPILEDSLQYDRHWMALAMLADVHSERKEHGKATLKYQEALNAINDPDLTPEYPNTAIIAKVFKKAEQSRLLAGRYVASPKNRDGSPGGLSGGTVRGFAVERVALPVTFPYNSTEFTAQGRQAAVALLADLQEQDVPFIILTGHTDPIGERAYNQNLSLGRARQLRAYLMDNGFLGQVRVEGRGEDKPYQPVDKSDFTQDELYRMCRRVEIERR